MILNVSTVKIHIYESTFKACLLSECTSGDTKGPQIRSWGGETTIMVLIGILTIPLWVNYYYYYFFLGGGGGGVMPVSLGYQKFGMLKESHLNDHF